MNNNNNSRSNLSDIEITYFKLIDSFYELYPDKKDKVKMNEQDMNSYLKQFCDRLREKQQYFQLLVKRDGKMFKGLNVTLLPKLKMEVVLNLTENDKDNESKKKIVDNMWDTIWLLYLLGESTYDEPDRNKMSRIALALDVVNKKQIDGELSDTNKPNMFNAFNNINMAEVNDIMGSLNNGNLNKDNIKDMLDKVIANPELTSNLKSMMSSMGIDGENLTKPTENSNKFVNDILGDIKSKFKLDSTDGKIDSKKFVEQLMSVGNTIGDSYSKKLGSGELSINDIIGAVSSMATNPDEGSISDLTNSLQLDKLDLNEVLDELKGQLNGKIPPELLNSLGGMGLGGAGGDALKNLNMSSLIGSMMGSMGKSDGAVPELTEDQKKELEKYYEDLKL